MKNSFSATKPSTLINELITKIVAANYPPTFNVPAGTITKVIDEYTRHYTAESSISNNVSRSHYDQKKIYIINTLLVETNSDLLAKEIREQEQMYGLEPFQ